MNELAIAEITLHDGTPVVSFHVSPDELVTLYPVGTKLYVGAAPSSAKPADHLDAGVAYDVGTSRLSDGCLSCKDASGNHPKFKAEKGVDTNALFWRCPVCRGYFGPVDM